MDTSRSKAHFSEARRYLPGGVDSPVRSFRAVGGEPRFIERGEGPYLVDVDGNRMIDYVLSWGPLILGHAHPQVLAAIQDAAKKGTSFGAPSPLETQLAQALIRFFPATEMVRFVNSGTEATMSALRLARAYTRRNKMIKFEGCYHGHSDLLLVQAGSGVATLGLPDSPGVPPASVQDTLVARFNDLESVATLFHQYPDQIAAVIVEPVAGNMGVVLPEPGFLPGLREITQKHGSLLIFDEVMTGFRVHLNGAQARYGVYPDLTTFGKVIGGGLPVGAYGGRREIMEWVAPQGPVYQAGTLSGNPLAMSAGLATLKCLEEPGLWDGIAATTQQLVDGLSKLAQEAGVEVQINHAGTMFTLFFSARSVRDWSSAKQADTQRFAKFYQGMLLNGVYLAPSQFEACFVSAAHTSLQVDHTLEAAYQAFRNL